MWPGLFALLSPAGHAARLSILIFHRVLAAPDPLLTGEPDVQRFDDICRWLSRWFNVLDLADAMARLQRGQLPARAAAITFDDGYADNHELALPILRRHGLTATFFIATGYLDRGLMWNDGIIEVVRQTARPVLALDGLVLTDTSSPPDGLPVATLREKQEAIGHLLPLVKPLLPQRRDAIVRELARRAGAALPTGLMMSPQDVVEMRRAGMGIGAHTRAHPILARLSAAQMRREMSDSRDMLESLLRERVGAFAYPNGKPHVDYNEDSVAAAREVGFDFAVSTAWGAASAHSDPFQVPRFTPWNRRRAAFGLRLAGNLLRAAPQTAAMQIESSR